MVQATTAPSVPSLDSSHLYKVMEFRKPDAAAELNGKGKGPRMPQNMPEWEVGYRSIFDFGRVARMIIHQRGLVNSSI